MIAELKAMADRAEPTAFHRLLKTLDDRGKLFRVYTQVKGGIPRALAVVF
jgi:NAD-dependent SIR2 family protein deacetylase